MSILPTPPGRRGFQTGPSAQRESLIERVWDFVLGIRTRALRVYGQGATTGAILAATNAEGDCDFTSTVPASTFTDTAETASQIATVVAAASGEYLLMVYAQCTTAGAAGTLTVTATYTDDVGAFTTATLATVALNATGRDDGLAFLRCSGGAIEVTYTVTGAVGNPQYAAHAAALKVR